MFTIRGTQNRREILKVGTLGLCGVSLADLLRHEASASGLPTRPKSVIYIVLGGGPSHIDTWDLKPQAPVEYRGPFKPIDTTVPGIRICEHFPQQAKIMNRLTLLRGVQSVENDHFLSEVYSGLPRTSGKRPAFGSVVSRLAGSSSSLPPYVSLDRPTTDQFEFEKPYYAGAQHAPFRPFGDALENLTPVKSFDRFDDRKGLLAAFDTMRREIDTSGQAAGMDRFRAAALDLITSRQAREAFDLSREPKKNIERFGKGKYTHQADKTILYDWDARPFVLARRLVEAGVRVVTLRVGSWDHHSGPAQDIFASYRHCLPALDNSIHALVTDLDARGLLNDVLIVVLGEFGRTPKLAYPGPGREHWAEAGCVLMAGGGIATGLVVGETDSRAERPKSGRITFQNVIATIYNVLGIDPADTLPDFNGRPQYLLDDNSPVKELIG